MSIGDHIQFTSTGCRGLVVKITQHGATDFVHVLCGPHVGNEGSGEILAFPRYVVESRARIL